jgi:uncharacterized SAM-binding protein YcdF (DUF218 family)
MRSLARLRLLACRTLGIAASILGLAFVLFLPFAGRFFDHEDRLERADLILVLAGARVERWLEGYELYKEGWAPKVVISPGPVAPIEVMLQAKGVRYPREGDLARDAMIALGVPADAMTVLPNGVDNTAAEAAAVKRIFPPPQIARIIVVTSPYHTRRAGFAFRREFRDTGVDVVVRGSRYSDAEPARWWRHRADIRYIMTEMPKLLAYLAGMGE